MPTHAFIYLASQSPRRAQLLNQLGVAHRPLLPDASEDAESLEAERPGERPQDYVCRVTLAKLQAARLRLKRRGLPSAPILCADTTVVLGRRILGKPQNAADAAHMLQALSGRCHRVLTAVAVGTGRSSQQIELNTSRVRLAVLTPATIARYIQSGEPYGKAGAYAIQGTLAGWIEDISGSHSGIMGLPLFEAASLLRAARVQMLL